jgi:CubicO group peptidase (beta-lactamase class C family)
MRVVLGIAIAAVLVFLPAAWAQGKLTTHTAAAKGRGDATIVRLEKDIPELMRKGGVPGLAIAVIRGGKTSWVRGFGVKDTKTGQPVTEDTVFEAASLSKPVFAYGVLKLVEQGKLGLDVPLTAYLPKPYIQGDDRLKKITARIVLSHRTGFPNWRGDGSLTIHFTPGDRFSYSGEGYVYLQRVVEQITGKALNEFMTEAVLTPLEMTSSSYVWRPDFDERTATGHNADGKPVPLWKPKEAGAASTLNTTVKDYALFVEAVLNRKGLTSATLREMETPQIALDPECRNCIERQPKELSRNLFWGLGWGIQRTKYDELWHWGDNGAFKSFVMAAPKTKAGVVMFANSENGLAIAKPVIGDAMETEPLAFAWLKYDSVAGRTNRHP